MCSDLGSITITSLKTERINWLFITKCTTCSGSCHNHADNENTRPSYTCFQKPKNMKQHQWLLHTTGISSLSEIWERIINKNLWELKENNKYRFCIFDADILLYNVHKILNIRSAIQFPKIIIFLNFLVLICLLLLWINRVIYILHVDPSGTWDSSNESGDWDLGLLITLLYPYPRELPLVSDSWTKRPKVTYTSIQI